MPFDSTETISGAEIFPRPSAAPSTILRAARAKVAAGWCQGCYGMSSSGKQVTDLYRQDVASVCAIGGIYLAARETAAPAAFSAICYFARAAGRRPVSAAHMIAIASEWNDVLGRTQQEVLGAFDRAITLAEAEHA